MKAISYSLFGFSKDRFNGCLDFNSYLRGLAINLRFARLIYPDWEVVLHLDSETYKGFKVYFDSLPIEIVICEDAPLTKAMLWRMKPIFKTNMGKWKYSHVIMRDIEAPLTYKEKQAVEYWINKDTSIHAITDSVSHNLPLMGGMIGVRPDYFTDRMNVRDWGDLMQLGKSIDYNVKGADQTFLNTYIYQEFANRGNASITQHYFQGMPNTFLPDFNTCNCSPLDSHVPRCLNDIEIDIPIEMKESQSCCGHIGSAGWYEGSTHRFLRKYSDRFEDLKKAESNFPDIFYWCKDNSI